MDIKTEQFDDVHLHAASLKGWGTVYNQISCGEARSVLSQLSTARFHAFRERIDKRVVQQGEAPRGHICFALPVVINGMAQVQGRDADANCMFVLQGGDEFMFHMPRSMDMLSITFQRDTFDRAVADHPQSAGIDALLKQPIIRIPAHRLAPCRQRLLELFNAVVDLPELQAMPETVQDIEQAMLDEWVRLIIDSTIARLPRSVSSSRGYIVETCHRITMRDTAQAPSIEQLSRRLRASRRTLQNSFQSVTETNPVNYLRSVRLNGVRRELLETRSEELSIGDAAAKWGFLHLSYFASKYQELFGELPSQTRRQGGSPRLSRTAPTHTCVAVD